jgi:DNA polymerase III subunit epsilon
LNAPVPDFALVRPLAFLDLETTGLTTLTARVVEIAVLKLRPGDRPEQYHTLVDPQTPIPATASAIHGITDADVVGKPAFPRISEYFAGFLAGCDLSGFNLAHYDLPVLAREFDRAGAPFPLSGRAVVDVLGLFKRLEPRT